jgi:hypothetical protein
MTDDAARREQPKPSARHTVGRNMLSGWAVSGFAIPPQILAYGWFTAPDVNSAPQPVCSPHPFKNSLTPVIQLAHHNFEHVQ